MTTNGLKGKEGVSMPDEVVKDTSDRYWSAYTKLTGYGQGVASLKQMVKDMKMFFEDTRQ